MTTLWQPYWQANTAYSLLAVVIPTTFGGYTWRCTTAGTSGNAEPTWPDPTVTPTVTDGTVVWSVGTGARQAYQSGVRSLVVNFAAANPTIVRSVRTVRPYSFANTELPCFYIGDMSESDTVDQGTWTRAFSGFSGFLVDNAGSVDESNDRMNFAADALGDLFVINPHAASGRSLFSLTAIRDTEVTDGQGAAVYPALEFVFGSASVLEGRA